jgi:hypothetical protein
MNICMHSSCWAITWYQVVPDQPSCSSLHWRPPNAGKGGTSTQWAYTWLWAFSAHLWSGWNSMTTQKAAWRLGSCSLRRTLWFCSLVGTHTPTNTRIVEPDSDSIVYILIVFVHLCLPDAFLHVFGHRCLTLRLRVLHVFIQFTLCFPLYACLHWLGASSLGAWNSNIWSGQSVLLGLLANVFTVDSLDRS